MFKITRSEANRNIILLALVLVPIVVLFTILATALACSEYWSLYRERRRLFRSRNSNGHTRRNRSDAPCLSSSSESSNASTKRSESSDDVMPTSNTDILPCLREKITTIPATQPLRIFKQSLTTVSKATTATSSKSCAPSYAIPRRHSSYAIRRPPQVSRASHIEGHPAFKLSLLSFRAFGNNRGNMEKEINERSRSGVNSTVRKIPSQGGLFSRVAQALDFNKQRYSSPGPVPGGFSGRDRPTRVYTESNSPNSRRYPQNHTICKPVPTNLIASPQQSGQRTPPLARTNLCVPKNRNNVHTRFPCPLPITSAKIDITMDAMKISAREDLFTWAAVEISANVANLGSELDTQIGREVPLDIMILVDNSTSMSPVLLKGACDTVLHLASSMDILVDRLAIGCISADPEQNLQLLLPLSTCNLDVIRGLLRPIQIFRQQGDEPSRIRTSKALHEASNLLLRYSSRGALRHVFVITANSGISLSEMTTDISSRVRFHTISPEPVLGIWASEPMDGWHLSASFDDEEDKDGVHALKDNIKQVMRHLRFGLDPGVLSNLSIGLNGPNGCDIEAILGETKCKTLRPGEKWTLLVKIKAVSEAVELFSDHSERIQNICGYGDSLVNNQIENDVDQMIDQLHGLLGSSDRAVAENIFNVSLEHSHSALSSSAVIKLENKCEVTRFPRSNSIFSQKVRRALHKDVRELYVEENAMGGRTKPIHSMHLSHHLDNETTESAQGENSGERSFIHSPPHLSPDLEFYNSPRVELGSMNPFRNLVGGCDGNCFHALASEGKAIWDQTLVSPDIT
ncbi:hypothetical protein EMCG_09170 [[Emmonsia] crescens]|uniref:VWFA domain-containing protein n=1 Tax=[Emmonsia] crescens TaxID=73230 RepID=A0A0G2JA14_9EURO|nr:hypothetical protein EMCG_09170 [Emmonsia crescens UAMH 3008]